MCKRKPAILTEVEIFSPYNELSFSASLLFEVLYLVKLWQPEFFPIVNEIFFNINFKFFLLLDNGLFSHKYSRLLKCHKDLFILFSNPKCFIIFESQVTVKRNVDKKKLNLSRY